MWTLLIKSTIELTWLGGPLVGLITTNIGRSELTYCKVKFPLQSSLQADEESTTRPKMILDGSEGVRAPMGGAMKETVVRVKSDATSAGLKEMDTPLLSRTTKLEEFADAMKFSKDTVTRRLDEEGMRWVPS